jgi:hypothetical protein
MALSVVASRLDFATRCKNGERCRSSTAAALRILIDHMLPVLKHAVGPADGSDTAIGSCALPADAALLLLGAAARILEFCVQSTAKGDCDYSILARSTPFPSSSSNTATTVSTDSSSDNNNATCASSSSNGYGSMPHCPHEQQAPAAAHQAPGEDALPVMLDAVLSLAYTLVTGGPWWEEARAKYPLLLIEALYTTSMVGKQEQHRMWSSLRCMLTADHMTHQLFVTSACAESGFHLQHHRAPGC